MTQRLSLKKKKKGQSKSGSNKAGTREEWEGGVKKKPQKRKMMGGKDENSSGVRAPARVLMISSVCFKQELISEGSNNPADMRKFLNAL